MATMLQTPAVPNESLTEEQSGALPPQNQTHPETALTASNGHPVAHTGNLGEGDGESLGEALPEGCSGLPVGLVVAVPVRDFRVRQLLRISPGEVIETLWGHGEDLPLGSGDVQLAWSEFEVVDTRLAVRITRLA